MEGSLGFIIFLVIAVASIVKHIREASQEEERRRSMPKTRPEELPEATRRMLYGDTRVPTAQERRAPAQPTVIVARPRQVAEGNEEGPRRVPPPIVAPPVPQPRAPRPAPKQGPVVVVRTRPAAQAPPRPPMPGPAAAREILAGAGRMAESGPPPASPADDGEWALRQQMERMREAERARRQAMAQARAARRHRLLEGHADLRRAIVLNEILGPPVALRDPFGPFQSGPSL